MKRILHADDVDEFRDMVRIALKSDYEVVSVEDSDHVMPELEGGSFDLVILDHLMPSVTDDMGFDVCQKIKAKYADLPVVIYTGAFEGEWTKEKVEEQFGVKAVFKREGPQALKSAVDAILSSA